MTYKGVLRMLSAAALAAAAPGCFFDSGDDGGPVVVEARGLLTVEWSVAGSTDPAECDYWGATDFELIVYDGSGSFYTEIEAPCEDFAVTVELPEDTYTADATLVDDDDQAISVTLPLEAVRVETGTELVIDVDFQEESML